MELTQDITTMFRNRYEPKWLKAIQQTESLVKPYVTIRKNCRGKAMQLPARGTTKMREYTGRFQQIQWSHTPFGERWLLPRKFYNAEPLEEDDILDLDTLSFKAEDVMEEQRNAMNRTIDEVILGVKEDASAGGYRILTSADGVMGGILAPNYTGENGTTLATLSTDPNSFNVIPVDYRAKGTRSAAGILLDKIALLRAKLQLLDVNLKGEEIIVAISPAQHMDLLLLQQTQMREFGFQSLTNGEVNTFCGVKFLVTNMLPVDENGNRLCCAWLKSKAEFGVWLEPKFRIEARSEYIGVRQQILVKAKFGATRTSEKTAFLMPCAENVLQSPDDVDDPAQTLAAGA